MAGKVRHLLNRDGRYFARLVIPKDLRPFMDGKTELRSALGADYRIAQRKLPSAVALLQQEIALAERRAAQVSGRPLVAARYPLTAAQIALHNYQVRMAFDEEIRNSPDFHRFADLNVDDLLVVALRDGMAGRLSDDQLEGLVGRQIERYRDLGNTDVEKGTGEWRAVARALCVSEYEALARHVERNEGDFAGRPSHPMMTSAEQIADEKPSVSIKGLLADYLAARNLVEKGREAERRWTPVFKNLVDFLGHDDARRVTRQKLVEWRDELLKTLAPKTVSDVYLVAVRTVQSWAVENDRLDENAADKVRQPVPKKRRGREKGFTLAEAVTVLTTAREYVPARTGNPRTTEATQTTAAKRWAPILCAFSGARISEITQLRRSDVLKDGETHLMRITPDAGTVKAGDYRDVPLHPQLIDLGFLDFVQASPDGPLFYPAEQARDSIKAARTVAGRVGQWLQKAGVVPQGVSPNHGWRHRFKTVGRELEISDRTLDAIQGHASKTSGDDYGDVTIVARRAAIDKFPRYPLT
jgi:integrase